MIFKFPKKDKNFEKRVLNFSRIHNKDKVYIFLNENVEGLSESVYKEKYAFMILRNFDDGDKYLTSQTPISSI